MTSSFPCSRIKDKDCFLPSPSEMVCAICLINRSSVLLSEMANLLGGCRVSLNVGYSYFERMKEINGLINSAVDLTAKNVPEEFKAKVEVQLKNPVKKGCFVV